MQYVGEGVAETGCIFCNRLVGQDDVSSLILHRAERSFAIMNLFPYNTGHIMLVPNEHVASPEDADPVALEEMATLLPRLLAALRRVLNCHGFNVGLNVGSVAGAGVAEHMHQHVVPRWNGDANFMPILGGATVMPELIPVTYAKLRAEIARDLVAEPNPPITVVLLDDRRGRVFLEGGTSLPVFHAKPSCSVWKSAVKAAARKGIRSYIAGWSGHARTDQPGDIAVTLIATEPGEPTSGWVDIAEARERLAGFDQEFLRQAMDRIPQVPE
jgi:ATP adenylyltransferase